MNTSAQVIDVVPVFGSPNRRQKLFMKNDPVAMTYKLMLQAILSFGQVDFLMIGFPRDPESLAYGRGRYTADRRRRLHLLLRMLRVLIASISIALVLGVPWH